MSRDPARHFTGGAFLAAAALLWLGWLLLPLRPGMYFVADDFAAIFSHWHLWIWMFRLHLFGMVIAVVALTAFAAGVGESPARPLVWSGVAVAAAGLIVGAVGAAYYYHFGAWGSREMQGKSAAELAAYVDSLRLGTEYVGCLVRFGRVFSGLGLVLLGLGAAGWRLLPRALGMGACAIGVAGMALTMTWPDYWSWYLPVFHAFAAWLLVTGAVILRGRSSSQPELASSRVPLAATREP